MGLRCTAALALICWLWLLPGVSYAQSGDPPPPPIEQPPTFESIPPLVAPVQLLLPWQCGTCAGGGGLQPLTVPEPVWHDMGSWFNWLGAQLWNRVALPVICWMLAIAQAVLNAVATALNLFFLPLLNGLWRLLILGVLYARAMFYRLWDAFEWLRAFLWDFWGSVAGIGVLVRGLGELAGQLLSLLADLLSQLTAVLIAGFQAFAYLLGLFFTLIPGMVIAVMAPGEPPVQFTNNILVLMFRDTLQAVADSKLGWAWLAFVALVYARFGLWIVDELGQVNT